MEITVKQVDLARIMGMARKVVDPKTTMPVLKNVLLDAEDGTLSVMATCLETSFLATCNAQISTPGKVATPAFTLNDLAAKAAAQEIYLKHSPEDSVLAVKAGKTSAKLLTGKPEEMPELPEQDNVPPLEFDAKELKKALQLVIPAISSQNTRFSLTQLCIAKDADTDGSAVLRLAATNGHRLHEATLRPEGLENLAEGLRAGISKASALRLLDFCDGEQVAIAPAERMVWVERNDDQLFFHTVEGSFPDYRVIMVGDWGREILVGRESLEGVLERVQPFVEKDGGIRLQAESNGLLTITGKNVDRGEVTESIEVETENSIDIGFQSRYLADLVHTMSSDALRLEFNTNHPLNNPMRVTGEADAGFVATIMPMRL